MADHTPGPFLIVGGGTQLTTIVTADGPRRISEVARMHPDWLQSRDPDEVLANALLFKAAPDLLDALEAIVTLMPLADARWNFTPEYRDATTAIAKARGEASS